MRFKNFDWLAQVVLFWVATGLLLSFSLSANAVETVNDRSEHAVSIDIASGPTLTLVSRV
jgi:hypothetical protein